MAYNPKVINQLPLYGLAKNNYDLYNVSMISLGWKEQHHCIKDVGFLMSHLQFGFCSGVVEANQ